MNNRPAFRIDIPKFMELVKADLPDGMFGLTVEVAEELIGRVAKRASVLGDNQLDDLMARLGIRIEDKNNNLIQELTTTLSALIEWGTWASDWAENGRPGEEPPTHPLSIARKLLKDVENDLH